MMDKLFILEKMVGLVKAIFFDWRFYLFKIYLQVKDCYLQLFDT